MAIRCKRMTDLTLRQCLECGELQATIESGRDYNFGFFDYVVRCGECGASTTYCGTAEIAVKAWNVANTRNESND